MENQFLEGLTPLWTALARRLLPGSLAFLSAYAAKNREPTHLTAAKLANGARPPSHVSWQLLLFPTQVGLKLCDALDRRFPR